MFKKTSSRGKKVGKSNSGASSRQLASPKSRTSPQQGDPQKRFPKALSSVTRMGSMKGLGGPPC